MKDHTKRCGATTRSGQPCRRWPGPNGRCRLHGGASTGPRTYAGIVRAQTAPITHGRYSRWLQDPISMALAAAKKAEELADASPDLSEEIDLLRTMAARLVAITPEAPTAPEDALSALLATMDRLQRLVEAWARIQGERERREKTAQGAAVSGAIPTPVSEAPPISEADRLRQWAAELQSEAEHMDLWPDGSCGEVCRQLVELARSFDPAGARGR